MRLNRPGDALTAADELVALAEQTNDPEWHAQGLAHRAWCWLGLPDWAAAAAENAQRAANEAATLSAWVVRSEALTWLVSAQVALKDGEKALATLNEWAASAADAGDVDGESSALLVRAWTLGELGRYREALDAARVAAERTSAAGRVRWQAQALVRIAWNLSRLKEDDAALEASNNAIAVAVGAEPPEWFWRPTPPRCARRS